ncbi:MAG TPA: TPM domain-containing protein [Thermoanaerobaculia bacterium]|nr:TPM domain-containing protein [Thermoanaerobaculia bacterium]
MSRIGSTIVLFLALAAPALAQRSIEEQLPPKPERYVTDRAGVLQTDRAEALNRKLEQFERDTSNQILVWIDRKVPENFVLEDFTVRAFQKWKVGQADKDNGAVLFVFVDDRKVRIEVGYGLEGVLPDITAKRIIENEILPRFRENDYAGGIEAGVDAMIAATKGEYKGTGTTVDERSRRRTGLPIQGCAVPLFFLFVFIILPMLARRNRRRWRTFGGSGWWTGGGGFGGGGWSGGGGGGGGFSGGGGSSGGGGASGSW